MEKCERNRILRQTSFRLVLLFLLSTIIIAFIDSSTKTNIIVPESLASYINWLTFIAVFLVFTNDILDLARTHQRQSVEFITPHRYKLLKITKFLFSTKTQKETFEQIMADWNLETYEAITKKEIDRLLIINLRNIYYFLLAIWLKSPIGDLIEFIRKIAK